MSHAARSRRSFLKTSTVGAAAVGAVASQFAAPMSARALGANNRLRIGFIGAGGRGFDAHIKTLVDLRTSGANVDLVAVSEIYSTQRDKVCSYIQEQTGTEPRRYDDYRDMLADSSVDAVTIATPDHWHARQSIDALRAGKHVYCEKPMTHTIQEAIDVVDAWKQTGKVMQVGVQSTSLPVWDMCRELIQQGKLGKVLMFQTEFFRNSAMGQWRYYRLTRDMTPKTIDWRRFLGVDEGLAPDMPFDRAVYAQWRRFWPFGSGMYTDLFVHRTTSMLKATGLRFPGRVVGGGGIYLEYDGRDVPDVATVVADFEEGVQGVITATMCNAETPVKQVIRGHFGSFVFGNGEDFDGVDFIPERPQVTRNSRLVEERIEAQRRDDDSTRTHFWNWLHAIYTENPGACNNPPDLGAAAIALVNMGAQSYRQGKVFHWDRVRRAAVEADGSWATRWETMSKERAKPRHVPGWMVGDYGSTLEEPDYQSLEGPWINGKDPAGEGESVAQT